MEYQKVTSYLQVTPYWLRIRGFHAIIIQLLVGDQVIDKRNFTILSLTFNPPTPGLRNSCRLLRKNTILRNLGLEDLSQFDLFQKDQEQLSPRWFQPHSMGFETMRLLD